MSFSLWKNLSSFIIRFTILLSVQVIARQRRQVFKPHEDESSLASSYCQDIRARAEHLIETQNIIHLPISKKNNTSSSVSIHDQSVELWHGVMNSASEDELEHFQKQASRMTKYLNHHMDDIHVADELVEEVSKLQQERGSCNAFEQIPEFNEIDQIIHYDFSTSANHFDAHQNRHPKTRQLRSQWGIQFVAVKSTLALYFTFNTFIDQFIWLVKDQGQKISHNRDDNVNWLPPFVWAILSSKIFTNVATFFERFTKNSPGQLKTKIKMIFAAVLLLEYLGGAKFLRDAFDFIEDMPLVKRVKNTEIYRRFILPAVKETKDNFNYITSKIDGTYVEGKPYVDYHGFDSEEAEQYLRGYLPDIVLSVLTRQQMADIIFREMKARKGGRSGMYLPADDTPKADSSDESEVVRQDGPFSASSEEEEDLTGTQPFEDSESQDQPDDAETKTDPQNPPSTESPVDQAPPGPVNDSSDNAAESAANESSSEEITDDIASSEY